MNRKLNVWTRGIAVLTAVLMLLPLFSACKKEQDLREGEPTLTVDEDGVMNFLIKLGAEDLQAHAEQTAYLYELTPGETVEAINQKSAMLQNKVSSKIRFAFPVTDEDGTDRRCNTYLMTFSDGTVFTDPVPLSNPQALATNTEAFPHANGIKGMAAGNEELARSLHSTHTLISLSVSELLAGSGTASWNGVTLSLNEDLLKQTDARVSDAERAEMQISLELIMDDQVTVASAAAVINLLTERYRDAESGAVTALIVKDGAPAFANSDSNQGSGNAEAVYGDSVEKYAQLMRIAHTALVSRVQNGRVYFGAELPTEQMKNYVTDVLGALKDTSESACGAALYPLSLTESLLSDETDEAQENTESDAKERELLLSDLPQVAEDLLDQPGRNAHLCVLGLEISAADPDLQAALYTYAYRAARNAKADFLIYAAPVGEETGLYGSDGLPRPAANCFDLADTSQNLVGETLASTLLEKEWNALNSVRPSRVAMEGSANLGASDDLGKRYFDFSEGDAMGIRAVGTASEPSLVQSESWNAQVMTTSFSTGAYGEASGLRFRVTDVKSLRKAHVFSFNLLAQSEGAEEASVTLLLEGTAADGRAISSEATLTLTCNDWQAVSFQVREFTSMMDENAPCTVTLTVEPTLSDGGDANGNTNHSLWLHSAHLRQAAPDYSGILLIGMIAVGFGVGFSVILIFAAQKKKRDRRDRS